MTIIHSNRAVLPTGIKEAYVALENGIIAGVTADPPSGSNYNLVDVRDNLLIPGVIDPHVHINEPGRTHWEGFDTATKAAVAGGVTTIIDMPLNSSPVTTTVHAFEQKLAAAAHQLHCNVGFWGGVIPGNDQEIDGLSRKGVLGFKAFLTHSGIDEFPNITEKDLEKTMPIIGKNGLPLLVHCELTDMINRSTGVLKSYGNYLATRPKDWEDTAIALMISLSEKYNCKVHIVHLSSANSIDQISRARERGLPITVETGQHYLYFDAANIKDGQTQFKCAPPIRETENNEYLWEALKSGVIDFVATDHSPATPGLKELESGDFISAWGGIASLQFALPALWTAAKKRNIAFSHIVKWLCENPAKLIGKEKSKGKIAPGYDADLVVLNEEEAFTVKENIIHHRHKITPYLDEKLYGVIHQTYLSGNKVYDKGTFTKLNAGKLVFK